MSAIHGCNYAAKFHRFQKSPPPPPLVVTMDRLVVDSEGDPGLQPWSTTFQFETDQKRLNSIREVKARLKPLEDKIDRYNAAHHVRAMSFASVMPYRIVSYHKLFRSLLPPCFRGSIDITGYCNITVPAYSCRFTREEPMEMFVCVFGRHVPDSLVDSLVPSPSLCCLRSGVVYDTPVSFTPYVYLFLDEFWHRRRQRERGRRSNKPARHSIGCRRACGVQWAWRLETTRCASVVVSPLFSPRFSSLLFVPAGEFV